MAGYRGRNMLNKKKKSLSELAYQWRHVPLAGSSEYLKEVGYDSGIPVPPSKFVDPIMRADAIPFNPWCILASVVIGAGIVIVMLLTLRG